jgi:hypothetical protein
MLHSQSWVINGWDAFPKLVGRCCAQTRFSLSDALQTRVRVARVAKRAFTFHLSPGWLKKVSLITKATCHHCFPFWREKKRLQAPPLSFI